MNFTSLQLVLYTNFDTLCIQVTLQLSNHLTGYTHHLKVVL